MPDRAAPYLPEPTGSYPVGTTSLHLTDTSRADPWAAQAAARELMVSLWYPAASPDGPRARYMTPAESELQLTSRGITGVPPRTLSTVRVNAAAGATPAGQQRSLPLVVLSPGFTNPRSGSPPAWPARHPGGARGSRRRWRQAGQRMSASCSTS